TPSRRVRIIGLWKPDDYYGGDKEEQKADLLNKGAITPEQYAQLRGRIVLAYFGFFYESTHLAELLKTVASRPNRVALLVAGRGHDQPLVAEYARHNSNVIFLGWLDEDEMRALYRSVDIVYQPLNPADNVNWRYFGSTNKLFESLAAGCVFVGSAINERVE